jgi:hypothetical protein
MAYCPVSLHLADGTTVVFASLEDIPALTAGEIVHVEEAPLVRPQEPRPVLDRKAGVEEAGRQLAAATANFRRLGYIR